jgi:hypothetical protein
MQMKWSFSHCTVLTSSSMDQTWKAWDINPDVHIPDPCPGDYIVGCPGSVWSKDDGQNRVLGATMIGYVNDFEAAPIAGKGYLIKSQTLLQISTSFTLLLQLAKYFRIKYHPEYMKIF